YSKTSGDAHPVLTIVNLDPHHMQHGFVDVPVDADQFVVRDLLDEVEYTWHRGWNYVRFDPDIRQGHILCLPKHPISSSPPRSTTSHPHRPPSPAIRSGSRTRSSIRRTSSRSSTATTTASATFRV